MKLLLALISLPILCGCPKPTVVTEYKYIEVKKPADPAPLNLTIPYFYVVSDKNQTEFLHTIYRETDGTFIAITPRDYEALAGNIQEFRRYIKQLKANLDYYESLLGADRAKPKE